LVYYVKAGFDTLVSFEANLLNQLLNYLNILCREIAKLKASTIKARIAVFLSPHAYSRKTKLLGQDIEFPDDIPIVAIDPIIFSRGEDIFIHGSETISEERYNKQLQTVPYGIYRLISEPPPRGKPRGILLKIC